MHRTFEELGVMIEGVAYGHFSGEAEFDRAGKSLSSNWNDRLSTPRQRKVLSIDEEVLRAAYDYSRESGHRLDDIYDEALRDYLKKKGQLVGLKEAFAQSARQVPANDRAKATKTKKSGVNNPRHHVVVISVLLALSSPQCHFQVAPCAASHR